MELQFKKYLNKPSIITFIRSDGTRTWLKIHHGQELHDLAHFVVEREMKCTQAFLGLIDQGYEASDFELPIEQKPEKLKGKYLPVEAIQTEHIINLLQTEALSHERNEAFLEMLKDILQKDQIPYPQSLNKEKLDLIREKYTKLIEQWNNLAPGKTLYLLFDIVSTHGSQS